MIQYPDISRGVFLARPNRFLARVALPGGEALCHVRNTGRCRELLQPGAAVWCQRHDDPKRKTKWTLITVEKDGHLFNLDAQAPNRLAYSWVAAGGLGETPADLRRERTFGDSRFDLAFTLGGRPGFLEVKGVTLAQNGVARFPDALTARGAKHLRGLCRAAAAGYGAWVLFLCQMGGVARVEPNEPADPAFAAALREAAAAGVKILALSCAVTPETVAVAGPVPVSLRYTT